MPSTSTTDSKCLLTHSATRDSIPVLACLLMRPASSDMSLSASTYIAQDLHEKDFAPLDADVQSSAVPSDVEEWFLACVPLQEWETTRATLHWLAQPAHDRAQQLRSHPMPSYTPW
jgi:hypothetical protein